MLLCLLSPREQRNNWASIIIGLPPHNHKEWIIRVNLNTNWCVCVKICINNATNEATAFIMWKVVSYFMMTSWPPHVLTTTFHCSNSGQCKEYGELPMSFAFLHFPYLNHTTLTTRNLVYIYIEAQHGRSQHKCQSWSSGGYGKQQTLKKVQDNDWFHLSINNTTCC